MDKLTNKKLLFISLGLLLINLVMTFILFSLDNSSYEHLDGREIEPQSAELFRTVIFGQVVSVPIFSFLIGLIVAIFIERKLPYSQRIFRAFLFTLTVIYGLYAVMGVIKIVSFI